MVQAGVPFLFTVFPARGAPDIRESVWSFLSSCLLLSISSVTGKTEEASLSFQARSSNLAYSEVARQWYRPRESSNALPVTRTTTNRCDCLTYDSPKHPEALCLRPPPSLSCLSPREHDMQMIPCICSSTGSTESSPFSISSLPPPPSPSPPPPVLRVTSPHVSVYLVDRYLCGSACIYGRRGGDLRSFRSFVKGENRRMSRQSKQICFSTTRRSSWESRGDNNSTTKRDRKTTKTWEWKVQTSWEYQEEEKERAVSERLSNQSQKGALEDLANTRGESFVHD